MLTARLRCCTFSRLCNDVTTLNACCRETLTLASGATQAATSLDAREIDALTPRERPGVGT